jgi:hypothetical protein
VELVSPNSREGRYAQAAVRNAFGKLADWPRVRVRGKWVRQQGRNNMLNKLGFKMGGLVANGWIAEELCVRVLMLGAKECGLVRDDGMDRCLATIYSGLRAGMEFPYPALDQHTYTAQERHHTVGVSNQGATSKSTIQIQARANGGAKQKE